MQVSIFGAGYVGSVSGACLAKLGHGVTLVDVDPHKVGMIHRGKAPIVESGLPEMIAEGVSSGRLTATTDADAAVRGSDVSIICVGTPSMANGDLDLSYVRRVCQQIGEAIARKPETGGSRHAVVVRSTMLPGSVRGVVVPTLEKSSGLEAGRHFVIGIYPEFLRESSAIDDFFNPAITVFGADGPEIVSVLRQLTHGIASEEVVVAVQTAEAIKYANNAWHAVKITFANEIGNICKAADIDGHEVMQVVCKDTRLNISPAYLRPGFAFGGSCLPKDLRALRRKAMSLDVATPLFDATMRANESQIRAAFDMVERTGNRQVSMLGLTFKTGTDDLRESPLVELAERLLGKGYELKIYDQDLKTGMLIGSNLEYVTSRLHHLSELVAPELDDALNHGKTIVVGKSDPEVRKALIRPRPEQHVIDLVRYNPQMRTNGRYEGICW
ncbi:GDP-mannose 6-dehydrogenase [Constrictibacter sp. MBR-5]|jgi:GDP-mannose 6-dehydrogenase|uniref:nucleotide sugar dehydrogenase n=1 Tax=Constrictibacter sp. MBR-5 TaxID=3156467 RepID=UPI003394CC61